MNSTDSDLKKELLMTLSYLEPMSLEMIFIDFSSQFLAANPSLTTEDLLNELKLLEKAKLIKRSSSEGQNFWIKIYPKRPWYKRLLLIPFKKN